MFKTKTSFLRRHPSLYLALACGADRTASRIAQPSDPPTKQVNQKGISNMANLIVLIQPIFYMMMKNVVSRENYCFLFSFNFACEHLRSYRDGAYI